MAFIAAMPGATSSSLPPLIMFTAIIVCTPEVSAVRDADRVVGLLPSDWRPELIINRLRPQLVKKGKMLSVGDVDGMLRLPLLGVIADEPGVIVATNKGEPLALDPSSDIGAAYRAIAAKVAGDAPPAGDPPQHPCRQLVAGGQVPLEPRRVRQALARMLIASPSAYRLRENALEGVQLDEQVRAGGAERVRVAGVVAPCQTR